MLPPPPRAKTEHSNRTLKPHKQTLPHPKDPKRSPTQEEPDTPAKRPDNSNPLPPSASNISRGSSRSSVPSSAGDADIQIQHLKGIIAEQEKRIDKAESTQGHDEARGLLDTAIDRLRRVESERESMRAERAELDEIGHEIKNQQKELGYPHSHGNLQKSNEELARRLHASQISAPEDPGPPSASTPVPPPDPAPGADAQVQTV